MTTDAKGREMVSFQQHWDAMATREFGYLGEGRMQKVHTKRKNNNRKPQQ